MFLKAVAFFDRMFKAFFFLLFLLLLTKAGFAENDDNNSTVDNVFSVYINKAIQTETDIHTVILEKKSFSPEFETFAIRQDLSPLLAAQNEYYRALAQQNESHITLQNSQKNSRYLAYLQRNNAVSTRKLREQNQQVDIDKAHLKAADQQLNNIRLQTRAQWGSTLTDWFLDETTPPDELLALLSKPVYLVYIPEFITEDITKLTFHPFGKRKQALVASLVSSAPVYNTQQTGTPFFYISDTTIITHHLRVVAWLPLAEDTLSGFIIPASALVWHLGQAYVYLQLNDEIFKRVNVSAKRQVGLDAYFIQQPLQEGDTLVISGAQMLLSEEFRSQIPVEDDDADDD